MKNNLFVAVGVLYLSFVAAAPKVSELETCHRSDPEINTCILNQLQKAVVILKDGAPEYGLPATDPLFFEFVTAEGDMEAIKIKMVMKNLTLTGFSDTQFTKVKFDANSLKGEMSFTVPYMKFKCTYFATGRLFVIPLESSADFDGDFRGVDMTLTFRLKTTTRKDIEYYSIDKMAMKMHVDKAKIKTTALNPSAQPQVQVIEDFFNANDRLVLDTVNPIVNAQGGDFFKHVIESYIRRIPASNLLLE